MNCTSLDSTSPNMQKVETGNRCTTRIAQMLAQVIKEDQIPPVVDEWKLYQHQEVPEDWYKTDESGRTRIDHYLSKVLQMKNLTDTEMFPHLKQLIKAVLALSQGNADAERSLSVNKQATGGNKLF